MKHKKCIIQPATGIFVTFRNGDKDRYDSIDQAIKAVEAYIDSKGGIFSPGEKRVMRLELKDLLEYKYELKYQLDQENDNMINTNRIGRS